MKINVLLSCKVRAHQQILFNSSDRFSYLTIFFHIQYILSLYIYAHVPVPVLHIYVKLCVGLWQYILLLFLVAGSVYIGADVQK